MKPSTTAIAVLLVLLALLVPASPADADALPPGCRWTPSQAYAGQERSDAGDRCQACFVLDDATTGPTFPSACKPALSAVRTSVSG